MKILFILLWHVLSSYIFEVYLTCFYFFLNFLNKTNDQTWSAEVNKYLYCGTEVVFSSTSDTICWQPKLAPTGLTGPGRVRVQLGFFYRFRSVNMIFCGISPPHPINIKGHGRLGNPIEQNQYKLYFLSSSPNPSFSNPPTVLPSSPRRLKAF